MTACKNCRNHVHQTTNSAAPEAWYNHRCMAQLKTHYDAINDQVLSAYAYCRDVNRDGHCPWFITSDAAVIDAALIEDKATSKSVAARRSKGLS